MSDKCSKITTTEWMLLSLLIIEILACILVFHELAECQSYGHKTMDCIMVMGIQ